MTYLQRHSNRQETFVTSMIRSLKTFKIPKAEPNPWSYGNTLRAFLCFLRHRIELDGSLDLLIRACLSQQQLRKLLCCKRVWRRVFSQELFVTRTSGANVASIFCPEDCGKLYTRLHDITSQRRFLFR